MPNQPITMPAPSSHAERLAQLRALNLSYYQLKQTHARQSTFRLLGAQHIASFNYTVSVQVR